MAFEPSENPITNPTRESYTELRPFRFWCQKVLPLVYDDSLSYYELLCKVVDYLNKTMEDVDNMNTDMDTLYSNFQQFQEGTFRIYNELVDYVNTYFDELDVQEEINNKLDEMVTSGELVTILRPTIAEEVSTWLAEHLTPTSPAIDNTLTISGAGADAQKTGAILSEPYSASKKYNIGDYVLYNGSIYICIKPVDNEAWSSAKWSLVNTTNRLESVASAMESFGTGLPFNFITDKTVNGITYTSEGNTIYANGTASDNSFVNLIVYNGLPSWLNVGDTLYLDYSHSSATKFRLDFFVSRDNGTNWETVGAGAGIPKEYVIPSYVNGILIRAFVPSGNILENESVSINVSTYPPANYLIKSSHYRALPSCDLNTVIAEGIYLLDSTLTYTNGPANLPLLNPYGSYLFVFNVGNQILQVIIGYGEFNTLIVARDVNYNVGTNFRPWKVITWGALTQIGDVVGLGDGRTNGIEDLNSSSLPNGWFLLNDSHNYTNKPQGLGLGFLCNIVTGTWRLQIIYAFSGKKVYKRRGNSAGTAWENWGEIGTIENTYNITNNYSYPSYSETVNLTASPQITSDTNNYLAPTGDTTVRTNDILTMLTSTGICRLGAGEYYIKNLVMPDNSSLIGSGFATKVILTSDGDFAIAPKSNCIVKDMRIMGGTEGSITPSQTVGNRHGILWEGTYAETSTAPFKCILDNLMINTFTGGGVTCYNTGYNPNTGIEGTNLYISNCSAGLNISYWSEFHKFTNVRCGQCYYGCINNGGNNIFVNCDFSSNTGLGMLMDNSQGQSPNNTHGSCVGCVFNHTNSNTGTGIEILNCHSGFIFSACQIFYSKINLVDSDGIVVTGANFGYNNCNISVSGGGAVLFTDCMVEGNIPVTVTNNSNVRFKNCYNKSTGAEYSPAF